MSLVLLLSALTAIILGISGMVLASVLAANAGGAEAARMAAVVAEQHARIREPKLDVPAEVVATVRETLDTVARRLETLNTEKSAQAQRDLAAYRVVMERFVAATAQQRREGQVADDLASAHVSAERSLVYLAHVNRPAWLDRWVGILPWVLFWVFGTAGVAVWRAWRLQKDFSGPLEALALASAKVGRGALDVEMPRAQGVSEVTALREAIESMRARLVASLAHADASREELQMILQHMSDGVALVDEKGLIREFNPAFRHHFEAAGGRGRVPDRARALAAVFPELPAEMARGMRPHDAEVAIGAQGTPPTIFRVRVNPVRDGSGRIVVIHDVTRERELEVMQRNFLSVVTHELKTPLTVVLGYNKLLLAGKGGPLNEKQTGFINLISREASKLNGMIQDLLDIARIEGDNLPIDQKLHGMQAVVARAVEAHTATAQGADIEMTADLAALGGARCLIDEVRVEQVLGNLIGNAIKFTDAGGRIMVRARREGVTAILEVEDTGRGIPPKAIPHLFEKFFQVDKNDTRIAGGAGLGLYISRRLVESQGGAISVASTLGVGTTFTVEFPVQETDAPEEIV